ncbi:hypothetical protein FNF27_01740 [Cafeteria roenbergensis]|uniref:Uncharacterized protein n=1 Tax=Cafeteria roenbergensis TaxID=33653 RepID=A0A5A8EI86_CAFRO|nr:hypothetical protein FNF27_01740 [Cafeteria roenbergensis]
MAAKHGEDHDDDVPAIRNLSGRWVMDTSTSSDRAALMEALGVGGFARFLMGNVVTTLQVEHSRTRLMIETIASMGTLTETHLLDGIVREKVNSGEQVLVKAWEEEDEAVVVETAWQKRALTSVDRRELVSRTRMKQTTRVLKAGDTRHEAVIFYTKLEDEGERLAAEAAEQAARESLAAQWASLGRTVATAPGEAAPAGAGAPGRQSSPAAPRGEAPSEADVAAARRTLAASKHMPRAKWDQSGTWKVDKKAGDPPHGVLEALGVPWIARSTVANLEVTTEAHHRPVGPPTDQELEEAGEDIDERPAGEWAGGVWCTVDRTSYGDSRSMVILDGRCRCKPSDKGEVAVRGWQVGARARAMKAIREASHGGGGGDGGDGGGDGGGGGGSGRGGGAAAAASSASADEADTEDLSSAVTACEATKGILAESPEGAIVTESLLPSQVVVVEVRESVNDGRRARSTVRVFKPVSSGAKSKRRGFGPGEYGSTPAAHQLRFLDNSALEGLEKAEAEALRRAEGTVSAASEASAAPAEAAAADAAGSDTSGAAAASSVGSPGTDEGARSLAPSRLSSKLSSVVGAGAGRARTSLDLLDLSGRWQVDAGRSQPIEAALEGVSPRLAALLRARLSPPRGGSITMHHTAWSLRWDMRGPASGAALAHQWRVMLDGNWRLVPHGDAGKSAPFFAVRARQAPSGAVETETRLVAVAKASSVPEAAGGGVEPPLGPTLREDICQRGDDRSSVAHMLTLVTEGGEAVGSAQRRLLRVESAEERMLAEAQARRRAEAEAARRAAEEAAAALERAEEEADGEEGWVGGDAAARMESEALAAMLEGRAGAGGRAASGAGGPSGRRLRPETRQGVESLLQAAVTDFFGEGASVSLEGGRAVLNLPPRDAKEAAAMESACLRQFTGEAGLLLGILAMALMVTMSPALSKAEAVIVMVCAMVVYAVTAATPCIRHRGEGHRQTMLRTVRERVEAGDDEGATEALLAEAAARTLERTMAARASERAASSAAPAPGLRRRRPSQADEAAKDPWGAAAAGSRLPPSRQ